MQAINQIKESAQKKIDNLGKISTRLRKIRNESNKDSVAPLISNIDRTCDELVMGFALLDIRNKLQNG